MANKTTFPKLSISHSFSSTKVPNLLTEGQMVATGMSADVANFGTPPVAQIKKMISLQLGYYDPGSKSAPRDFQTILEKAPHRFRATGMVERRSSRHIYEELATGRLYYVDEGHPGYSAHLEVFSADRHHLGEADIHNGELDTGKRVNGRTLRL